MDLEPSGSPSIASRSLEFSTAWSDRLKVADEAVRKLREGEARRGTAPGSGSSSTQAHPSRRQLRQQKKRTPRPRSRLRTKVAKPFSEQAEVALRRVVNDLRRTKSPVSSLMREDDTDGSEDLTADGIMAVLKRRAPRVKLDPSEAGAIVAALDIDRDGHITSRDFIVGIQQVRSRMGLLAQTGSPSGSESMRAAVGGAHGGIRESSTPLEQTLESALEQTLQQNSRRLTMTTTTTPDGSLSWHELSRGSPLAATVSNSSYRRRIGHCECTESPRAKSARDSSMHKAPRDQRSFGLRELGGRGTRALGSRCSSIASTGRATSEVSGTCSQESGPRDEAQSTSPDSQSRLAGVKVKELAATRIAKHVRGYLVRLQIQRELAYILRKHGTSPSPAGRDGDPTIRAEHSRGECSALVGRSLDGDNFSDTASEASESDVSRDETPADALTRLLGV
eukprot:COSAG02_NODE_4003_length_5927_cov_5.624914_7_plen_451_part_00